MDDLRKGAAALGAAVGVLLVATLAHGALDNRTITAAESPLPAPAVPSPTAAGPDPAQRQQLQASYRQIPLQFEKNEGQVAPVVQYLSRGAGYSLFLTPDETVLSLEQSSVAPSHTAARETPPATIETVLRTELAGANRHAPVTAESTLSSHANYLIGNDPARWHRNVAEYARVRYSNVYDGIDLVYYGNQQQLEYDFVVAPGADPGRIRLRYPGVKTASIDGQGNLHLAIGSSEVIEHKPVIYQDSGEKREPVTGAFQLVQRNDQATEVAFAVDGYDRSRPLVIDPILTYSTFWGGTSSEGEAAMVIDASGAAYFTGNASGGDFPVTPGAFQTSDPTGALVGFVTKFKPDGSGLVYSTFIGGSTWGTTDRIAVDGTGAAYVTGVTASTDFPVTSGAFQTHYNGGWDGFVSKLSPDGSSLVYSTFLGGTGYEYGWGVALDSQNEAYVIGVTSSTDFPVTAGAFQTHLAGLQNVYVSKLKADGSGLLFSTYLGGSQQDYVTSLAVDSKGMAYIAGWTDSRDFPIKAGAFQATMPGQSNGYVTKLKSDGGSLVYSTYLGGSYEDDILAIAVDANGDAFVAGSTQSTDFPATPGAFQTKNKAPCNVFVTKLNPGGTGLLYSTYLGGTYYDTAAGLTIDASGNAYVVGQSQSLDFPTTPGALQPQGYGTYYNDGFLTEFNATGTGLLYSTYVGGTLNDGLNAVQVDRSGTIYVGGGASFDFPTTLNAYHRTPPKRSGGMLLAKFSNVALSTQPGMLNFGNVDVGKTSAPQTVTVTNGTNSAVRVVSVYMREPEFAQTNNCIGIQLFPAATCTINLTFVPIANKPFDDNVTVITSAGVVGAGVNGVGIGHSAVSLTPTSVNFGTVTLPTSRQTQTVVLVDSGTANLTINSISISGAGYSQTNSCNLGLLTGYGCVITVTFSPSVTGTANGTLTINTDAASSPDTVPLTAVVQ